MCGIAGFWSGVGPESDTLLAMARSMAVAIMHRGPDDAGAWADAQTGIALGHRRLSILDLSPAGHQPMVSASGCYVIAFNGEIYNHLELREELEKNTSFITPLPPLTLTLSPEGRGEIGEGRGEICWRGHSDTETLLAGFEAWGVEARA